MFKKILLYIPNLWLSCYNVIVRRIGSDVMNKEISILDVAKELICKFNREDKDITQLKLQKLLYFIEAYYMAMYDKDSLYKEKFYAWTYGPVSKEIYSKYKNYMDLPIRESGCANNLEIFGEEIISSFNRIYNVFGKLTSSQLIKLTHMQGSPWFETPTNFDAEIPKEKTKKWFKEVFIKNV